MLTGLQNKQTASFLNSTQSKKTFVSPLSIQRKLSIGQPNDKYEQEADSIADKVVSMSKPQVQTKTQTGSLVQRKCTACEEEDSIQKKSLADRITPLIQKSGGASEGQSVACNAITSQINNSRGSGHKMDISTQNYMSGRFGTDFSGVKIHTDNRAIQLSQQLNAHAFTVGNNIYFNKGKYKPSSNSGKHLLAHELTHTVQQSNINQGAIQRDFAIQLPNPTAQYAGLNIQQIQDAINNITSLGLSQTDIDWITDILGTVRTPASIDEVLINRIGRFQTQSNITVNGMLDHLTIETINREIEAEGNSLVRWRGGESDASNQLFNLKERLYAHDIVANRFPHMNAREKFEFIINYRENGANNEEALSILSKPLIFDSTVSGIDFLSDNEINRFRNFQWGINDYPGGTPGTNETRSRSLSRALSRIRPERRGNSTVNAVVTRNEFNQSQRIRNHISGNLSPIPAFPTLNNNPPIATQGNGHSLYSLAQTSFIEMRDAALLDGVPLVIRSSYRTPRAAQQNAARAGNAFAVASFSTHTLGLAFDLALSMRYNDLQGNPTNFRVNEISTRPMQNVINMRESPIHKWMFIHGARFGWYPYQNEPWHWEYNPPDFRTTFRNLVFPPQQLANPVPTP